MGARGEIGGKVQKPRHHVTVEQPPRKQQRRLGEDIEKTGGEKERQALSHSSEFAGCARRTRLAQAASDWVRG